ncbi:MAG TPA: hypothetical protein VD926_09380, partial [Acidimicrobiales bacterium]|nr:hypothetical protein [Acidimicrobiales bacterium]
MDEDDDDFVPPRRPRGDDGGVRPRELVLLAVTVLAIAGTVLFGLRWKDLHDDEVKRQDVETSAS